MSYWITYQWLGKEEQGKKNKNYFVCCILKLTCCFSVSLYSSCCPTFSLFCRSLSTFTRLSALNDLLYCFCVTWFVYLTHGFTWQDFVNQCFIAVATWHKTDQISPLSNVFDNQLKQLINIVCLTTLSEIIIQFTELSNTKTHFPKQLMTLLFKL